MTKLISILLAILLLCSCSAKQPLEEPQSGSEVPQNETEFPQNETEVPQNETEVPQSASESQSSMIGTGIFEAENGKYGIKDENGEIIVEAAYDEIKEFKLRNLWKYIARVDNIPALRIFYDDNGRPYIEEVLAPRYYFLDSEGNKAIDMAFESYYIANAHNVILKGAADGNYYEYVEKDGKLVVSLADEKFEREKENGFVYTGYHFSNGSEIGRQYRGMKRNGEVLFENVTDGINILFDNRLLVYMEYENGSKEFIVDENGNILCDKFQSTFWHGFDNGKTVGIGIVGSIRGEKPAPTYDENGEPMPEGFWFIDKDGNILSEKFDFSYIVGEYHFKDGEMVFYEEGKEIFSISLNDYAFEP